MAKDNNLDDFLLDIANTIRTKKGTTDSINPQDFSNEILSIKTSSEKSYIGRKDVNFYDYDGTLLYAYTLEEANNLTALPDLPTQDGLTCQGWNWDLTDVQSLSYPMDIGAVYITDNGNTRIIIELETDDLLDFTFHIHCTSNGESTITVNWGDGNSTNYNIQNTQSHITCNHTYSNTGRYQIEFVKNNAILGDFFNTTYTNANYRDCVKEIYFGTAVENSSVILVGKLPFLKKITIPNLNVSFNCENLFTNNEKLEYCTIPKATIHRLYNTLSYSYIRIISFPKINLDESSYSVVYDGKLKYCTLTSVLAIIPQRFLISCERLQKLIFNENLETIGSEAFRSAKNITLFDFSRCTKVPTLANLNAFTSTSTSKKIIVPDSLYTEWTSATNWTNYNNYIVRKSDYTE